MTTDYLEKAISVNAAAKKYGIPQRTLARWAALGRLRVLARPTRPGQSMLVDEASVVLARQAYIPHWRQDQGRNLPLPLDFSPAQPETAAQAEGAPSPAPLPTPTLKVGESPGLDTAELIEAFNRYNRRLSPSTLEGYHFRLTAFATHFPTLPLSPGPLQDYVDSMEGSDAHRHTSASVLRTLYRWAYKQHRIPREIENPIELVKFPRDGRRGKLPRVLTDEEAVRVISAGRSYEEITMLRLLWTSGIRAGELRSLTRDMIYPRESASLGASIRPNGKTGERKVWITDDICQELQLVVKAKSSEHIFTDRQGNALSKDGLFQRVEACMKKAGIKGKKRGPYAFRHTFITNIIADSGDLMLAKNLAGHTKVSTTERYTHLADTHTAGGFDRFNPEHRLRKQKEEAENGER